MWRAIGFCGISARADQFTSRTQLLTLLSMAAVYTFIVLYVWLERDFFFFFLTSQALQFLER